MQMSQESPLSGAPRIHGELLMLGIEVAWHDESTLLEFPYKSGGKEAIRRIVATPDRISRSKAIQKSDGIRTVRAWDQR
jgi:hypothetical protein